MEIEIIKTRVTAKSHKLKEFNMNETTIEDIPDKHADEYYTTHMESFSEFYHRGWKCIKVLEFLNGKQWDDIALGYVHSLRPSSIRVTEGMITLDARIWRVTVYIDKENVIDYITQEVIVGLPDGVANGEALSEAYKYGIDSPQCQWHNDIDSGGGYLMSPEGYFVKKGGEWVKYPEPEVTSENLFEDEND